MAEKEHLKLVIVGHVDHGKSTLIGRLFYDTDSLPEGKLEEVKATCESLGLPLEFAFVMDHLQEEREQGVTIDTAQTFFKTDKRHYVIIDAPGHVEFIKNMITGASQAEAAILIVDANEGVQEQTKRHAYVLSLLGLKQVIVVINKMDLVEYNKERFDAVKKDVLNFLKSINIEPSYIIPISAREGYNVANASEKMDWCGKLTVLRALDTLSKLAAPTDKPLRYPIQDVYKRADKRLLVGRVESGTLKKGDEVTFLPSNKLTRVKSIEVFEGELDKAEAGKSIGITIADPYFIERGEVLSELANKPNVTNQFAANLFWMSKTPFAGEELMFKCATQEVKCGVEIKRRLDSSSLEVLEENANNLQTNNVGEVKITTREPIVIDSFNEIQELGRFVLVKDNDVVAGGIVTHTK